MSSATVEEDALSLYLGIEEGHLADLEVAATAAIEWSQAIRAAAQILYPGEDIRVELIAAERGSSKWLARIERSKLNQSLERAKRGWQALPLIVRIALGLVVVVPVTAVPTYEYWTDTEGFSDQQKRELKEIIEQVQGRPTVEAPKRKMYRTLQRDTKIVGVGTGVPDSPNWRPSVLVPANQFAEADGLFSIQEQDTREQVLTSVLDVIVVAPTLENAERVWIFRQEGIPGRFSAIMKDRRFLAALNRKAVREQFRTDIRMTIRLEVRQRLIDGEWKTVRKGRSVVEVISPQIDPT